jgi:integrase/recombinase XerD
MISTNTFGISFFLKKDKAKNEKIPIYARITVDKKYCDVSLKYDVAIENWNQKKGMAKGKSKEIQNLNTFLEQIRSRLVECYQELQLRKKLITAEAVKKLYLGEEEKEHSLMNVFEYHNSEMKRELEPGTQKNYGTTKRYLESFLKQKFNTSDIYLSHLNYKFLADFVKFVKENPLDPKKPCTQNGTMKHVERLRKVVNLSIKNEWLERDPFLKFSPHFVKKDRGFLLLEEIEAIENKVFSIDRLKLVKDRFVFSCYTGLAYADAMKLVPSRCQDGY